MLVVVAQPDASDVPQPRVAKRVGRAGGGSLQLQSAEHQPRVDVAKLQNAVFVEAGIGIPLASGLVRAARGLPAYGSEPLRRVVAKTIEKAIQTSYNMAFTIEFRIVHATPVRRQDQQA
ncbi:hypothetical protein GCM10027568_21290 [Humibacter soli]